MMISSVNRIYIIMKKHSAGRLMACLALFACLLLCGAALAEEADWRLPLPWPEVIDRVSDPNAYRTFEFEEGEDLLEVVCPPLADCDALLIRCGGKTMLVDCATYAQAPRVVRMLELCGVDKLDYVLITHPHHDHTEGLQLISDSVPVSELLLCFPERENNYMTTMLGIARQKGITVTYFTSGEIFELGKTRLTVWQREGNGDVNNRSAQIKVDYYDRSMMLTGDIEPNGVRYMMEDIVVDWLDSDILKYPHHGVSAMPDEYMQAVSPAFIFMTSLVKERHGKNYVAASGIPWTYTNKGLLRMTTNGFTWLIETTDVDKAIP